MTPIAFLRQMLAAGMDMDTAMAAAETFEQSAQAEHDRLVADLLDRLAAEKVEKVERRRANGRARQARYEERKRQNASECVSERQNASDDAKEGPQTPKKNTPFPPLKGGTSPTISASPEKPKLKPISVWVAEIWEITPRPGRERSGRKALETSLKAAAAAGHDLARVKAGLIGYYASPDATKNDGQFAKGVDVAIRAGRWEAFAEDDPPPRGEPPEDPWRARVRRWKANQYWNSEWGPAPNKPGYQGPPVESRIAA